MPAQPADLDELRARLSATEARLDELVGRLGDLHPDDIGRVQALAEDGLARADNAREVADGALGRLAVSEGKAVDALARSDNAQEVAEGAVGRLVEVEATAADALGRADNARDAAERAEARMVEVDGKAVDAVARADNAREVADGALGRLAVSEGKAVDALARAGNAQQLADEALRRAMVAQGQGDDALDTARQARDRADDALQRIGALEARANDVEATARLALDTAREALLPARMAAFAAWLELCPPPDGPLLSVILPTRDRPALLPRAIASVMEQLYEHWELIVVDDGETDAVARVLTDVEDERIIVAEGPRRGLGAARNAGLDRASGGVVCYLDDDNVMYPLWLAAVAHVFSARADIGVAYGIAVAEHRRPGGAEPGDWWPSFWQLPWSREALLEENVTDAGALAHRRELEQARFDEGLTTGEDWDLLLRLTADREAIALPAVSHAYAMGSGGRMSDAPAHRAGLDEIRMRHSGS